MTELLTLPTRSGLHRGVRVGVDVGSSLTKLAVQEPGGNTRFQLFARGPSPELLRAVEVADPVSLGLTGGGAAALASQLPLQSVQVNEFTAWGAGARQLLDRQPHLVGTRTPYLLVSLGTGTSVMVVDESSVTRAGGTALGGGTILGLGAALLDRADFAATCLLADQGTRDSVDLLVRDIYPDLDVPLKGDLTAASFGRLARSGTDGVPQQDLAASIMRLVGENVALIAGGHAHRLRIKDVVFGGSTLRKNPALARVLEEVTLMMGLRAFILEDGEFAGALGAMEWAPTRGSAGTRA
jgi:type II pantothenate kinase